MVTSMSSRISDLRSWDGSTAGRGKFGTQTRASFLVGLGKAGKARWVPKMLTFYQKTQRVSVSADRLNRIGEEENEFLTCDVTWTYPLNSRIKEP
ncbi:hypothetical protein L798_10612 [Zootermopsis nevadensis]|uniref:Uncharacterized protein n=1 Tax=Zootermopsis nevadensis TaxID=136037 RepID=A0A067R9L6_ZOONE|nr:hypothetical protein L798_10612 [Zootermopsis nevadensis]